MAWVYVRGYLSTSCMETHWFNVLWVGGCSFLMMKFATSLLVSLAGGLTGQSLKLVLTKISSFISGLFKKLWCHWFLKEALKKFGKNLRLSLRYLNSLIVFPASNPAQPGNCWVTHEDYDARRVRYPYYHSGLIPNDIHGWRFAQTWN